MKFDNIVGNEDIKNNINDIIEKNVISHSYIFNGQEGIGKKRFAEEFAQMILCISSDKKTCETCESCVKFISSNHPDFIKIEPNGTSIKIAQIRELQRDIYKKPVLSYKKVIIINDAEKMTEEAQNCLLKTLEEPPNYIVIILVTLNKNLLLNTIKSRCVEIKFNDIPKQEIIDYIKENNLINNFSDNLINLCNGSIGKVHKIKENIQLYEEAEEFFVKLLNKEFDTIADALKQDDFLYKEKENIYNILDYANVIVYEYIKKGYNYFGIIYIIENTKNRIKNNANFEMSIDYCVVSIYDHVLSKA